MRADDLPAIAVISGSVHGRYAETEATYAERLALHPGGCLVFERDGAVAGFLTSHPWQGERPLALNERLVEIPADSDSYYLHDIAILPAARGVGAGKTALAFVIDQARHCGLAEVMLMAVNGADSFWSSQGFSYAGPDAHGAYGDGAHFMRLTLDPAP